MTSLVRGDLLPDIRTAIPGAKSRRFSEELGRLEAPGINTLYAGQPSLLWREALGANVLDVDGNRFLDLTAGFGVAAIGHRHPQVVAAAYRQSRQLLHGLADVHAHPARLKLSRRLVDLAPLPDAQVYYGISGSDAVEIALKTAVLATGRSSVLAFDPAYHGVTLGSLQVSSRAEFRGPFEKHFHGRLVRLPYGHHTEEAASALRDGDFAAVIVEPIVGREGVLLPPPGWLSEVAGLAKEHGACFIADEIFTGFGRSGSLFAVEQEEVEPDLVCCGKALGGGWPIAAVLGRRELMQAWKSEGEARHTATFVAHPVACAAALACLEVLDRQKLVARARVLGHQIQSRLADWSPNGLVDIRGRGLLWGFETETCERAQRWSKRAFDEGLLVLAGGAKGTVLQLCPPLSITEAQLEHALQVLRATFPDTPG